MMLILAEMLEYQVEQQVTRYHNEQRLYAILHAQMLPKTKTKQTRTKDSQVEVK